MEQMTQPETLDSFIAQYDPQAEFVVHGMKMPLGMAMMMGRRCIEDLETIEDQITYVATGLAEAGSLLEDHHHLLPVKQEETVAEVITQPPESAIVSDALAPPAHKEAQTAVRQRAQQLLLEQVVAIEQTEIDRRFNEIIEREYNKPTSNDTLFYAAPAQAVIEVALPPLPPIAAQEIAPIAAQNYVTEVVETVPGQTVEVAKTVVETAEVQLQEVTLPVLTVESIIHIDEVSPVSAHEEISSAIEAEPQLETEQELVVSIELPSPIDDPIPVAYEFVTETMATASEHLAAAPQESAVEQFMTLLRPELLDQAEEPPEQPPIAQELVMALETAEPEVQAEVIPLLAIVHEKVLQLVAIATELEPEALQEKIAEVQQLCAEILAKLQIDCEPEELEALVASLIAAAELLERVGTRERKFFIQQITPQHTALPLQPAVNALHGLLGMVAVGRRRLLST